MRLSLDHQMMESPELFPMEMGEKGYTLTGHLPESKKIPGIRLRQVRVGKKRYTLRPSFVMGYMSGTVDELDSPLFLLSLGVPAWAITRVFGRNDLYWHRQVERLGRNSLVGTTVSSREGLPEHIAADEHHARALWSKRICGYDRWGWMYSRYGTTVREQMRRTSLKPMQTLKRKRHCLTIPTQLISVNTDGWTATKNAFLALFPTITVIRCFLHGFALDSR